MNITIDDYSIFKLNVVQLIIIFVKLNIVNPNTVKWLNKEAETI